MHVFTPLSIPFRNKFGKRINTFFLSLQLSVVKFILGINSPVYYIGSPPAWEIVKQKKRRMFVYERTDIFEEMPGADKEYITQLSNEIINASELILYVNRKLMLEDHTDETRGLMIGHGVDYEMIAKAWFSEKLHYDIKKIHKPIVGFFGDINEGWCDFDLIQYSAQKLDNFSFVLIGSISSDVSSLKKHNNIYFLGPKPYVEIPHYGICFDVAIMPWNQNRWIEYCNTVKTKEYLSLGKPIVSVDYPELTPYHDIVYTSEYYDGFIENIQRAYNENHDNSELSAKCKERVVNETWAAKVGLIEEKILNRLPQI
jgi:glycosyltransferase involved in cell wall biosynthesis